MHSARRQPALNVIPVADLDDPRLEPYRDQKDAWLRAQRAGGTGLGEGLFLAEGDLVVRTLLTSGHHVVSLLATPGRLEALRELLATLPPDTPVFVAERPVLEQIVGFDLHRGVLALGRRAGVTEALELGARADFLVLCEDLANHDNVGAIFRNVACLAGAAAPGVHRVPAAVLLSPRCADPLYRKALRVSMGHALRVPFATLEPWPDGLDRLRAAGFTLAALTPGEGAVNVDRFSPEQGKPLALVVGAEGPGLRPETLERADARLSIPMAPGADSLNVATALAVAMAVLRARNPQGQEPAGAVRSQ